MAGTLISASRESDADVEPVRCGASPGKAMGVSGLYIPSPLLSHALDASSSQSVGFVNSWKAEWGSD